MKDRIELSNADNLDIMKFLADESVDVICIDPPYLYLKNQKLERVFDEQKFFSECKRLLTKKGFIVMFGRGESFYRWNTLLADLGFVFKEEIVWNKSHCTSPLMNLSRVHETVSIFTKSKGTLNKVKIPYLEMKSHDIDSIVGDVKRMRSILKNTKSLNAVLAFLENNVRDESDNWEANNLSISSKITKEQREVSVARSINKGLNEKSIITTYDKDLVVNHNPSTRVGLRDSDRSAKVMQAVSFGLNEKSIIRTDVIDNNLSEKKLRGGCFTGDRAANGFQSISFGLNEKSIIKQVRDHYSAIHPTQKPVRLLERLLNLVLPKDKKEIVIADFFAGSMSCMEAVINLQNQKAL